MPERISQTPTSEFKNEFKINLVISFGELCLETYLTQKQKSSMCGGLGKTPKIQLREKFNVLAIISSYI